MASLVLKMSISLDGFVDPVGGNSDWSQAGLSEDGAAWTVDTLSNASAHLIGAATYARPGYRPRRASHRCFGGRYGTRTHDLCRVKAAL
jgi:hypothetical protein